ncbi:MAG: Lrp/AsnC ligand binding domain-containing protein [Nitrosopumilus sp.]
MGNSSVAFVLIMCQQELTEDLVGELAEIDVVKEITLVEGPWKIILKLESSDLDHIRDAIRWKIRRMEGIESTLTLIEYMT